MCFALINNVLLNLFTCLDPITCTIPFLEVRRQLDGVSRCHVQLGPSGIDASDEGAFFSMLCQCSVYVGAGSSLQEYTGGKTLMFLRTGRSIPSPGRSEANLGSSSLKKR